MNHVGSFQLKIFYELLSIWTSAKNFLNIQEPFLFGGICFCGFSCVFGLMIGFFYLFVIVEYIKAKPKKLSLSTYTPVGLLISIYLRYWKGSL